MSDRSCRDASMSSLNLSSEATPIAYLTALNFKYRSNNSSKHPTIYTYCSFNAFQGADIRIRIEFPWDGNVKTQKIFGARDQKPTFEIDERTWDELFVSGIVRSVIIGLDRERKLPGLVEKSIIQSISASREIITKLVKFLDKGHLLGSRETVSKPTIYENFLIDTLFRIVELTGLFVHTINEIRALKTDIDLSVILIRLYLLQDKEHSSIQLLNKCLSFNPRNFLLLNEQAKFLLKRGNFELAIKIAIQSLNSNPIYFDSWYILAKAYILNNEIAKSLIALNGAPMYMTRAKDILKIDHRDSLSEPLPLEGKIESVWQDLTNVYGPDIRNSAKFASSAEIKAADPNLLRINRQFLRGTHRKAYDLLVSIVGRLGWDNLLATRSKVFIMDEEHKSLLKATLTSDLHLDDIRKKRMCEKWLDDLFLVLYEDLRVVMIIENGLQKQNPVKHSLLEWELIGLTAYRAQHYNTTVSSLRTSLSARFSIVAAEVLLNLWSAKKKDRVIEKSLFTTAAETRDFELNIDQVLDCLIKSISYNIRFYDEFQISVLFPLKKILSISDTEYIKNTIQISYENDNNDTKNSGVIPTFDNLVHTLLLLN
ncbi:hypothetical protein WICMUC_004361 [Wickerhamomyces mucosus]|uniref:Uncharacterized protein n=1 Tax=Wickerhamomyces mucosus TaxID=1378264 RepID=A0A9P8PHU0_9ASCO|nr:hypothetical protein WICMUC_004361 [Wickerhamomyces mucosus]